MSAFYGPIGFPVVGLGPAAVTFGLGAAPRVASFGPAPLLVGAIIVLTRMDGELVASTVADGCLIGWTGVYGALEPGL